MDTVTMIYAAVTILTCWGAYRSSNKSLSMIGAITFCGWMYYQVITRLTGFSAEQAWLATGDAVQAILIMRLIARAKLGSWPLLVTLAAFVLMLSLHLIMFKVIDPKIIHYHTLLNVAYLLQLSAVAGMLIHHGVKAGAFRNRHSSAWNHSHSGRGV